MKKCPPIRRYLLLFLLAISFGLITACEEAEDSSITTWDRIYTSKGDPHSIFETQDGGFLVAGDRYHELTLIKSEADCFPKKTPAIPITGKISPKPRTTAMCSAAHATENSGYARSTTWAT